MDDRDFGDVLSQVNDLLSSSDTQPSAQGTPAKAPPLIGSEIQALTRSLLGETLAALEIRYLQDQDGDFTFRFGRSRDRDFSIDFWISLEGTNNDILSIRSYSDREFTRSQAGRLLMVCNTWNNENRWPRAWVAFPAQEDYSQLGLDYHVVFEHGVQPIHLKSLINIVIHGIFGFWYWFDEQSL